MYEVMGVPEAQPGWWNRVRARTRRSAGFALAVVLLAGIDLLYHFLPLAVRRIKGIRKQAG